MSLFAQLVAGPIVRFRQIEADLDHIDRADRTSTLEIGWSFFIIGLVKKVLIADTIATVIDPALRNYSELSTLNAWLCMLGYAYQLYFDFSGYSDMAVGLGYLFGLRLPQNFRSPYKALDIAISGDAGTYRCRRVCVTIFTSRSEAVADPAGSSIATF